MIEIKEIDYSRIEELLQIMRERALWMESIGKPMWDSTYLTKERFIQRYNNPRCYLAMNDGITVGGFILLEKEDFFWADSDDDGVFYIHKLVVDRKFSNRGLGKEILKRVIDYSRLKGKTALRLDYYSDRESLKSLYDEAGFIFIEKMIMPDNTEISKCELLL